MKGLHETGKTGQRPGKQADERFEPCLPFARIPAGCRSGERGQDPRASFGWSL